MKVLKNKWFVISLASLLMVILIAYFAHGIVASWLTKETLQSNVQVSLLLQGDEGDLYESPAVLTSTGAYKLRTLTDLAYNETTSDLVSRENLYGNLMAGVDIPKDPKVFITKKSGAPAYLYIEVLEDNFPAYFTEGGFEELNVNDSTENPNSVKPIYYYLEDFWTPVYQDNGEQAIGENGGKLYVYYNGEDDYFSKYNIVEGIHKATYLSSYIMKDESNTHIDKQQYYGENEVKKVDGNPIDCPYFNIIKNDTVYVSEKYIHSEYYSSLYSDLTGYKGTVGKDGYDFGLYFFSYMASAKIDGEYATPMEAYSRAGFMEEEEYLKYLYESTDENPENIPTERIVYVWEDHIYTKRDGNINDQSLQTAVNDYFEDGDPYKVVLMESFDLESTITVPAEADFVFDMNGQTLSAVETGTYTHALWVQSYTDSRNKSNVTIRGAGTIDMGDVWEYDMFIPFGKLVIENGNYIRNYKHDKIEIEAFGGPIFGPYDADKIELVIKDGYFDNGYWCVTNDDAKGSAAFSSKNTLKLLPLYDLKGGRGWLMNDDGSYMRIDPDGNIYKVPIDENGNHQYENVQLDGKDLYKCKSNSSLNIFKEDNGRYYIINEKTVDNTTTTEKIYLEDIGNRNWQYELDGETKTIWKIYPERGDLIVEKLENPTAYVRVLDEKGNWILDEDGKYKLEAIESFDRIYGPNPRSIASIISCTGGCNELYFGTYRVYGGTFVVQNPAWGDEVSCSQIYAESSKDCPEDYNPQRFFNPWYQMWHTNGWDGVFLDGQIPWQDESIPEGYTITESSTTYTYLDEETGEVKSFYVPVYTVNYSGEIPD